MRVSGGVGTCSQPFRTLKTSSHCVVAAPAPSADALMPEVPIAPVVAPVMIEAFGSARLSETGAAEVRVGNTEAFSISCTRCCEEVALADCPTQKRRNSILKFAAAAGLTAIMVV